MEEQASPRLPYGFSPMGQQYPLTDNAQHSRWMGRAREWSLGMQGVAIYGQDPTDLLFLSAAEALAARYFLTWVEPHLHRHLADSPELPSPEARALHHGTGTTTEAPATSSSTADAPGTQEEGPHATATRQEGMPWLLEQPRFWRYTLPGVLPGDGELVFALLPPAPPPCQQTSYAILTLVLGDGFAAQTVFNYQEAGILWALLEPYPIPCSYATLHAALIGLPLEDAGHFIEGARQGEVLALALHPLRVVLGRCRGKLEAFNLEIRPVDGLSCGLFRLWD
ncbi:MAG TPA: hypothetical protein VF043_06530 [Ktedonobacteraceae bacterium]